VAMSESASEQPTRRYLVYRSAPRRNHLCVVAARDAVHALVIAGRIWVLGPGAYAIPEARP